MDIYERALQKIRHDEKFRGNCSNIIVLNTTGPTGGITGPTGPSCPTGLTGPTGPTGATG